MAHTYDTKVAGARSNDNPKSFNHICGTGATLLILTLVIDGATPRAGGDPTYNGVAMTQADQARQAASSPETTVEMWYMLDPPTGSAYAISIPNSGTVYITAESVSFKASSGNKTALREASYATATSTNPTGPTHSVVAPGDMMVAVVGYGDDSFSGSAPNGTSIYVADNGTYGNAAQYLLDGSAQFLKWTDTTNEDWAIVSAVFKEVVDTEDVNVSKAVAYGVLTIPDGPNVSKAVAYAVLSTETTIAVAKVVAYAVLEPGEETPSYDDGTPTGGIVLGGEVVEVGATAYADALATGGIVLGGEVTESYGATSVNYVAVRGGTYRIDGTTYTLSDTFEYAGLGSIATLVYIDDPPTTPGQYRYDLLSINVAGVITVAAGVESATPVMPATPAHQAKLNHVLRYYGQTAVVQADIGGAP
jgi:hypothetical protein